MKKRNESTSNSPARKHSSGKLGKPGKPAKRRSSNSVKSRRLSLEDLESRQLMAVLTEVPIQPAPANLPQFDAPRNVGTVAAFNIAETESTNLDNPNNTRNAAQFLPFGTGSGKQDTIDVTGTLPVNTNVTNTSGFAADIDVYSFDLRSGDIIDIATLGAAGEFALQGPFGPNGLPLPGQPAVAVTFASNAPSGALSTPLQTNAVASGTYVVPRDGRYFLTIAPATQTTTYTLGLRAYRPTSEFLVYGDAQILYLDWEGGIVDNNVFLPSGDGDDAVPPFGFTFIPSLEQSLPDLGLEFGDLENAATTADAIANGVYAEVIEIFEELTVDSVNGDFEATGVAGDYAIRILNSRDPFHRQWYEANANDPRLTRLLIGGTAADTGLDGDEADPGQADFTDIGNFDLSQIALFPLDGFVELTADTPISPNSSRLQLTSQFLASIAAHEAAQMFGMIPTNNVNTILSLGDNRGGQTDLFAQGLGNDGIFGTLDDVQPIFANDFFDDPTIRAGFSRTRDTLTTALSSGTIGGVATTGSVFNDVNRSGTRNSTEVGIAGVTVFADINNDGIQDPSEPNAITDSSGSYSLTLPPGTFNIRATTPSDFLLTTPASVSSSTGAASFGFVQVVSNITGTTFVDTNGNGLREPGEGGIGDIYIYIDEDGDNRPDLFEINTRSREDGTYSLNFPGPGTYTIRQVLPPGFEQTFPASGEHTVVFDGTSLTDNFDFGFLPSRDLGDAPDSYGTTDSANGASHGIVAGLTIGTAVDREADGQPSANALGDDAAGIDDEDGVTQVTPLGPGSTGNFAVTVTNTTGSPAYLQGFMDFNGDGDFTDAGEQFTTNQLIPSSAAVQTVNVSAAVPAGATPGNTFARFRLSLSQDVGATGFVASGEVEDYAFNIQNRADILNADPTVGDPVSEAMFTVSRNTLSNPLDVLANDFEIAGNPLRVDTLDRTGTEGVVVVGAGGLTVDYTPPNGFSGVDQFRYSVVDSFGSPVLDSLGNRQFATVTVNVTFQSNVPIAVDDSFQVPEGSVNRPLNVLDNDVPSVFGGLTITSVTAGSNGGNIQIIGGGQSLRYTPLPNFSGTEQFTYSIQDTATPPNVSTAQVTVNMTPGSTNDDVVDFTVGIFDPVNINTPVTNVRVGDEFLLRVSVEDLDPNNFRFASEEGVASAFLDLLYTDELVALRNTGANPSFPFDISFGPLFSGSEDFLQRANANTPGLFDEVGGVQPLTNQQNHDGPVELFTIRMVAVSPGVAQFTADPADETPSETVIIASDTALTPSQLGLGRTELIIVPSSDNFTSAIDDAFSDGRDSLGALITNNAALPSRLDVLDNDNLGPTGAVRDLGFGLVTNPTFGTVSIDDNGTPNNPSDDFFSYRANANANGLERFTYFIITDDGVRSTAEVTIPLGNTNNNALVAMDLSLVSATFNSATGQFEAGAALPTGSSVSVGQTFGVQVTLDDLRTFDETFVFAGFLDLLYSSDTIRPVAGVSGTEFDFDVEFGANYREDAGVGTAARLGIIDEFGSLSFATAIGQGSDPATLATLFFEAVNRGPIRIAGSPADSSPFQDTLLFDRDQPVEVGEIRYDVLTTTVVGNGEGESIQNPVFPQDVNNDGAVSPIDALLIINRMGRSSSLGEGEAFSRNTNVYYTDVNGDNETTAIDALQVINYLARNANQGEGELVAAPVATLLPQTTADESEDATVLTDSVVSDSVFADLTQDSKLLSTESTADSAAMVPGLQTSDESATDDDEDILGLLADDVQGLWS
ncbi:Serine-aspartate repeat-containing protein D precursor [Rubripirellula obstinata]|uniref:Serine-aspartate repeat-containing protein D n=1 Tax=Rubripirellula obstinata TaxID=406547 RepID=A0A5B1CNJ6_9BACT|nr:Ig-like domain-containing protein [Rubripirellula obstinata]KAA1261150.1 Serine-aspartate repeat-containing protein D precursor [Rubripirellula obstinata]